MDKRESDQGERFPSVSPTDGVSAVERFSGVSRDLYIEIFGVLVPGFFFLILLFFGLVVPIEYAAGALGELRYAPLIGTFIIDHAIISFIILLFFAYVSGHIFYRSDPKRPDFASIARLPKDVRDTGCVRSIDFNYNVNDSKRYNGAEEYPYGHLYEYLTSRGFHRLADYIPWQGTDFEAGASANEEDRKRRSKHLINTMKLKIKCADRLLFFEITRNEAHIRLMSSLWYLSLYVLGAAATGVVIAFGALSWISFVERTALPAGAIEAVLFPALTGAVALSLRRSIEGFFHYQRVREIVFVLQALSMVEDRKLEFPRRSHRKPNGSDGGRRGRKE